MENSNWTEEIHEVLEWLVMVEIYLHSRGSALLMKSVVAWDCCNQNEHRH